MTGSEEKQLVSAAITDTAPKRGQLYRVEVVRDRQLSSKLPSRCADVLSMISVSQSQPAHSVFWSIFKGAMHEHVPI